MQRTGTLEIDSNRGISKLDGIVLAISGDGDSQHQVGDATTFLEDHHFEDGDQAQITGDAGKLPDGTSAIFMTDAQAVAAVVATARRFTATAVSAVGTSAPVRSQAPRPALPKKEPVNPGSGAPNKLAKSKKSAAKKPGAKKTGGARP